MSIYKKIQACRAAIKACDLEKKGYNKFSNYPYYLPEQVDQMVNEVCSSEELFHKFDLKRNEHGLYGVLTIISLEDQKDRVEFIAATEMPTITATNASQQMGGCMTFAERYLKQAAFNIIDNNLDFDSQDQSKKNGNQSKKNPPKNENDKEWLNENTKEFNQAKQAIAQGLRKIKDVRKKYKVSTKVYELLKQEEPPIKSVDTSYNQSQFQPQQDDLPF